MDVVVTPIDPYLKLSETELAAKFTADQLVTAGLLLMDNPVPEKTFATVCRMFVAAMRNGSDDAQALLGRNYMRGWGVPRGRSSQMWSLLWCTQREPQTTSGRWIS
jgi:hypothetical protein